MPGCTLLHVRTGTREVVLTGHPDYIRPRDLSDSLVDKYGKDRFRISFRRNIYLVYVDIDVAKEYLVSKALPATDRNNSNGGTQDCMSPKEAMDQHLTSADESEEDSYQQNLKDVNLAEKLLQDARSPKTNFQESSGSLASNILPVARLQEPARLRLRESSKSESPTPGVHRQMILGI